MARAAVVRIEGLNQFRRTLREMDRKLPKELAKDLQKAAESLLPAAKEKVPVGPTGKLKGSLRVVPGVRGTSIQSSRPYANWIYWGGSTGRGHVRGQGGSGSVKKPPTEWDLGGEVISALHPFVHQAAAEHEQELLAQFERAFLSFASRNGWR